MRVQNEREKNPQVNISSVKTSVLKFFQIGLRLTFIIGLLAILIWGWKIYHNPNVFPIKEVKISAPFNRVDQKTISSIITPYLTDHSLLSLNMSLLKSQLLQEPWVEDVIIKRVWPDQIMVIVQEQKPVAVWNKQALLNDKSAVFSPPSATFPEQLPAINCPDGQQAKVWQKYQSFNQSLAPFNLNIVELDYNSRGSWQMTLNNNVKIILGRMNIDARFARFIAAYPHILANQINNINAVDLRYPDGFAVAWKNPNLNAANPSISLETHN